MFDSNIYAELIFDYSTDAINVPERLRNPDHNRVDQLCGTVGENLCELAGRACYDSLGTGRNSDEYHKHILEVGHFSVYEHYNVTFVIETSQSHVADDWAVLSNRPGLHVDLRVGSIRDDSTYIYITTNPRVVLDWHKVTSRKIKANSRYDLESDKNLYCIFKGTFSALMPDVFTLSDEEFDRSTYRYNKLMDPECNDERWCTLLLCGSRGFSHEQVRHGDYTAISQRSTRYVDESNSPWVVHPLVSEYMGSAPWQDADNLVDRCRNFYNNTVFNLQEFLICRGVSKPTARKQARGAARGYLGNALYTEIVFSATVNQWLWMIESRANPAADAEIRTLYADQVLPELQKSAYKSEFEHLQTVPCEDGIGNTVIRK